jgi:hypothetical protein
MEQETKTYVLKCPVDEAVSRKLSIDYAAALTAGVRSSQVVDSRDLSGLIADLWWVSSAIGSACHLLSDGVKLPVIGLILGEGAYE